MKTFGKIAALAISLIFIIGIMVLPVNAAGNPEITVSDASGNIGDEVTVIISLTSNPGIAGFNADITYDKNNLELTDMSGNSGFGGSFMGNVIKSKFVWYNASNITSTSTFATLKFKIKDTAKPNTYEIGLSYSQGDMSNADGDDVTATIHAGKITVTCNHTYGSWEKNTAENHKHTCKVCGNVEAAAHTWDSGKVTEAPTHTKEGTKTYTCTVCGETKTEKVEKLKEHSYGEWTKHDDKQHKHSCVCGDTQYAAHIWDAGKVTEAPTHTKEGTKTYTCTVCGETKTEKVEKLKEHSYGEWTKHDDKQHKHSCVCGDTQYAAHTWDSGKVTKAATCKDTGEKLYTCTACGEAKTEAIAKTNNHTYGSWEKNTAENHKHTCKVCGNVDTAAHTWDNGKVTKAATCKDTGEKLYTCTACGETKTEAIAKTNNHTYGSWEKNTAENHKHTCKVCGNVETAAHTWDNGKVTVKPTSTTKGQTVYTCTLCGETKTVETAYSHSHSYGIKWHYDNNMHWHECTGCGSKQTPRAHTFGEAKIITPATHTSTGKAEYKCTVCGATVEKEIAKITEHNFGEWSAFDGEKHVRSCECGEKEYASHTAGEWETVKEATYTSTGEKVRKCTVCGTVVSREEIPAKVKDTTKPVGTTTTNKTETTTTTSSTSAKQTETTKSTESKGCKSFVGVGASFTCVLAIGTALVLGKKKDD